MLGLAFVPLIFMVLLFIILGILVPISLYSAQKWAYKSYKEIVIIRNILQENRTMFIESGDTKTKSMPVERMAGSSFLIDNNFVAIFEQIKSNFSLFCRKFRFHKIQLFFS